MIDPSKTAFVIPARGGSKRIPGKNLIAFGGKPLIDHSITFAQGHKHMGQHLLISTDDSNIKNHCKDLQLSVLDRPKELASDTATTVSVLQHLVNNTSVELEWVVLLQATNPLRPKGLLEDAFKTLESKRADSLLCVSTFDKKLGKLTAGRFTPYNYHLGQRSQDMEPLYRENGLLYISKVELLRKGILLGPDHCVQVCDHPYSEADIDTQEDLNFAEFLLKTYG